MKHPLKTPSPLSVVEDTYYWPDSNPPNLPDSMVGAEEPPKDDGTFIPSIPPGAFHAEVGLHTPISFEATIDGPDSALSSSTSQRLAVSLDDRLAAVDKLLQTHNDDSRPPAGHNRRALQHLAQCIYDPYCARKPQLVILVSDPFHKASLAAIRHNRKRTILHALDGLNVSYIFSPKDIGWAQSVHAVFPDEVKIVLFDRPDLRSCLDDTLSCVRSTQNPTGIPAYKMMSWQEDALGDAPSPFGHAWTLTAEETYDGRSFVGFSFSETCRQNAPYIEPADRLDQVFILATLETYFWPNHNVWPPEYFEQVGEETKAQFVASLHDTVGRLKDYPKTIGIQAVPNNLVELGMLSEMAVLENMGRSRALLGLWDPRFEDVVLEALCLGVPFLNPIHQWDKRNPSNRQNWVTQNMELNFLHPPYVYNIFADDYAGFKKAIVNAMETPIKGFIPPHLTDAALRKRLSELLERDWKSEAQKVAAKKGITEFLF
ncbi:hypothetical protein C8F01DRAFT_537312 [Mycena amicta]|nr:hypothetical protein C8F01DRAFT_537312 [Mycena amicta]